MFTYKHYPVYVYVCVCGCYNVMHFKIFILSNKPFQDLEYCILKILNSLRKFFISISCQVYRKLILTHTLTNDIVTPTTFVRCMLVVKSLNFIYILTYNMVQRLLSET